MLNSNIVLNNKCPHNDLNHNIHDSCIYVAICRTLPCVKLEIATKCNLAVHGTTSYSYQKFWHVKNTNVYVTLYVGRGVIPQLCEMV